MWGSSAMNILILNWRDPKNFRSGGAEYVTHEHAKYWVKKGNRVTWITSGFVQDKKSEMLDGVQIVRFGNAYTVFLYAALYYFRNKKNIDLIVDEVHGVPFFSVLYAKKPIILFIHEVAGAIWSVMYPAPINWIGRWVESWYLRLYRNHRIWTDAPSTVHELETLGIPKNQCKAIFCSIANQPLSRAPKKNINLTCISVGRIVRMKRIEDILTAFFDICKIHQNAQLWIVGDGDNSYINELKKIAFALGISDNLNWYGKVPEKEKLDLLSRAHFLLHTSVKEGWGLVVLEAASQWTPSVVYGVSGLVDTVRDNETGIVISTMNPHDMAQSALSLYEDKNRYERMQKKATSWSGSFRWEDAGEQSMELLTSVYKSF